MDESILESVKEALGIVKDYPFFDDQLILYTNSALGVLAQTGVGTEGFTITGAESKWSDFLGEKADLVPYSKAYVVMRVRLMFDPPQSSTAAKAVEDMIREYEWRGYVQCDPAMEKE